MTFKPYKILVYDWYADKVIVPAYGNWFRGTGVGRFETDRIDIFEQYGLDLCHAGIPNAKDPLAEYVAIHTVEDEMRWSQFLLEWS